MYTSAIENIFEPVLAIDMGTTGMRTLLYLPDVAPSDQSCFFLPSPERLLTERIKHHTNMQQGIYIHGTGMGSSCAEAIKAHRNAGLAVSIHPQTAATFSSDPAVLENLGITVIANSPPQTVTIKADEYDQNFWHNLISMAGLPMPEVTLIAAMENGRPFDENACEYRLQMLQNKINGYGESGFPLESSLKEAFAPTTHRLTNLQTMTQAPVIDTSCAAFLGILSLPAVTERSFREGILAVRVGKEYMSAALIYQGQMFGILELPIIGHEDIPNLMRHLESFRLGWLPQEVAEAMGGIVCVVPQLPAEAEGFRPMFVSGQRAGLFEGYGKIVNTYAGSSMGGCWGLLHGYSLALKQ